MRKILFVITALIAFAYSALAQDYAKDTFRVSAIYNRTDIPYVQEEHDYTANVNGFTVEGDVKLFRAGRLRGSLAYNFKQAYNVVVYPDYFDGMKVSDLDRNVQTHSGGVQLGYAVKGVFEPFGALFYGTRKIHTDAPRQTVRTFRIGANLLFSDKSPFFAKAYYDFENPYGQLPMGFVNPDARTLGFGAGFRF